MYKIIPPTSCSVNRIVRGQGCAMVQGANRARSHRADNRTFLRAHAWQEPGTNEVADNAAKGLILGNTQMRTPLEPVTFVLDMTEAGLSPALRWHVSRLSDDEPRTDGCLMPNRTDFQPGIDERRTKHTRSAVAKGRHAP